MGTPGWACSTIFERSVANAWRHRYAVFPWLIQSWDLGNGFGHVHVADLAFEDVQVGQTDLPPDGPYENHRLHAAWAETERHRDFPLFCGGNKSRGGSFKGDCRQV